MFCFIKKIWYPHWNEKGTVHLVPESHGYVKIDMNISECMISAKVFNMDFNFSVSQSTQKWTWWLGGCRKWEKMETFHSSQRNDGHRLRGKFANRFSMSGIGCWASILVLQKYTDWIYWSSLRSSLRKSSDLLSQRYLYQFVSAFSQVCSLYV